MFASPITISRAVVDTILETLTPLLLPAARGSHAAAREAALEMLSDYHATTREEFRLAAEIIAFGLKALGALREASLPTTPNGIMLKLLRTASTLQRNEASCQRKLDALQRARRQAAEAAAGAPHPTPRPDDVPAPPRPGGATQPSAPPPPPGPESAQPPPPREPATTQTPARQALAAASPAPQPAAAPNPYEAARAAVHARLQQTQEILERLRRDGIIADDPLDDTHEPGGAGEHEEPVRQPPGAVRPTAR